MGSYGFVVAACTLIGLPAVGAGVSIDFESGWEPITVAPGRTSQITGQQVPPLVENSAGWADVDMTGERLTAEPYAGQAAWRVNVTAVRSGRAQLYIPGLDFQPGQYLRLRAATRSPQSSAMELAIRLQHEPWTAPWQRTVMAGPEWREFDFIIPPIRRAEGDPYALIIGLGIGTYDLDNLSLEYLSEQDLASGGEPRQGNLAPHSVFPSGLPSPWSVSAGYLGSKAEADPQDKGPSGQPSLHLIAGRDGAMMPRRSGVSLVSPPFELNSLRPHAVSFWAKGEQDEQQVQVVLGPPQQASISGRLSVTRDWQRYAITGQLPLLPDGYAQLTLTSSTGFRLDGLQVEEAEQASGYQPASPVELALTSAEPYSLCFEDQPLRIHVRATGELAGLKAVGRIECLDGPTVDLPAMALDGTTQTLTVPGEGVSALGTYRVELRAENAAGEPQSGWQEIVLARVHRPRYFGEDAPDSPFGIHINALPDEAAMVKALGFNWVRIHDAAAELTKWYFLEDQPGHWEWSDADAGIDLFRGQHLMILGMLDTAPTFRSNCPPEGIGWHSKYFRPKLTERDAWADYCRRTVARYQDRIGVWEVWNEPYIRSFFQLQRDPAKPKEVVSGAPDDYVALLKPAYAAAKQADPDCEVIWADQPGEWHEGGVAGDAQESSDTQSFHAYIGAQPNAWPDIARRVDELRAGLGTDWRAKAVWDTEGGTGGQVMQSILRHTPPADRREVARLDAEFLVRYELACLAAGVKRFFLYTYHKWTWSPDWNHRLPDGSLAPNATALSNLMWQVEDARFVESRDLGEGLMALVFESREEQVAVVLRGSPTAKEPGLPAGVAATDTYGNLVLPGAGLGGGVWYLRGPSDAVDKALASISSD